MRHRGSAAVFLTVLLVTTGLSGCIAGLVGEEETRQTERVDLASANVLDGLETLMDAQAQPLEMDVNVTVNVVFVGLAMGLVDTDEIEQRLPAKYSPEIPLSKSRSEGLRSGLDHQLSYAFHQAPEAFADELFANYPAFSEEVEVPGGEDGFLARYDQMYEQDRLGSGTVHQVDAAKVETWMHENRDDHGLAFEDPEYTVFFLDSWTNHGLWEDSYYWYAFNEDTRAGQDTRNLRAWGGTYDFLFMDYAAAPNDARDENTGVTKVDICCGVSQSADAPEGSAYNDPPMWHYEGDTATIGKGPMEKDVTLTDRVHHGLDVATNLRLIGDYAFTPVYKERYHVNVHLWHDGRSAMPTEGLDDLLSPETLQPGLQGEIPWSEVTVSVDTYVAPEDDPGMAEALDKAKAQGVGSYIPIQPIYQYVDAHKEKYKQNDPDVFDVMALLFLVEGHYTFFLPLIVGGVAFGGPDGTAWGTISSRNDMQYVGSGQDMDAMAEALVTTNAHEIGHFFGLTHAHDGTRKTADGYEPFLDHTWSSTNTVMSYRMRPDTTGTFHKDVLARAHTLQNIEQTLDNTASTYRALDAAGLGTTPGDVANLLEAADEHHGQAWNLFQAGDYQEGIVHAIQARQASEDAMAAADVTTQDIVVHRWTNEGVTSAGASAPAMLVEPSVVPTGMQFDYRPVEITEDVERVQVRITWENTPASWGDFFIGWATDPAEPVVNVGPFPYGAPVSLGGGIHDNAEEGPTDGTVTDDFTLDLDTFDVLKEEGTIHAGAGTQGNAVNGAYEVEIVVTYRDHGDGAIPDGVQGSPDTDGDLVQRPVNQPVAEWLEDLDAKALMLR